MSTTWAELRKNVLTLIDVDANASTSSNLRTAVDLRLKQCRDRLYSLRCPDSLITLSPDLTLNSSTVGISLFAAATGTVPSFLFSTATFKKPIALLIEDEDWEFVSYLGWLRQNSSNAGDQRWARSWTLYQDTTIYLRTYPSGTTTWTANLLYMQQPATISDGGIPELKDEFQELLVCDVVRGFPNRFISEERLALFADISNRYKELMMLYKAQSTVGKISMRLKPFVRNETVKSLVNWGTGDL